VVTGGGSKPFWLVILGIFSSLQCLAYLVRS